MSATGWKGLPISVLHEADITVDPGGLVRIPYRLADGSLYACRVVAPSGRRWWEPGDGRPVIPFGLDRLEAFRFRRFRRFRVLLVAEGESDALAVRAALAGYGVDVLGVPGASTWQSGWARHSRGYAAVYVGGDGDDAGRQLDVRVCADVPGAMSLRLPAGEDLRSLLQRDGAEAVLELMAAADREQQLASAFRRARTLDELLDLLGLADTAESRLAA